MKNIKDWAYINSENVRGILVLWFALFLLLSLIYGPRLFRKASLLKFSSSTTIALVATLIQIKGIHQSDMGNKIITSAYHVHYFYEIDTKMYKGQEVIKRELIPLKDRFFLSRLMKGDTIRIGYKETAYSSSRILIDR